MDLGPLWIAGRFLSRFPFPDPGVATPTETGRSVLWYPLIGGLMGLAILLAASLLGDADPPLAAALVLVLWVWTSGAMHLDGIADSADAWVGGLGSRERTLTIMKDPRCGPMGVTVIALVLIAKWAGLQALLAHGSPALLWWLPALGRTQLLLLMLTTPYARQQGMAADQFNHLPRRGAWLTALAVWLGCLLATGWHGLALVTGALGVLLMARRGMLIRLAGFTGDTAGALVELTETALLLLCALLATH